MAASRCLGAAAAPCGPIVFGSWAALLMLMKYHYKGTCMLAVSESWWEFGIKRRNAKYTMVITAIDIFVQASVCKSFPFQVELCSDEMKIVEKNLDDIWEERRWDAKSWDDVRLGEKSWDEWRWSAKCGASSVTFSHEARARGPGWCTAHASSIDEKGLVVQP